jgi:two-component system response regulator NreC
MLPEVVLADDHWIVRQGLKGLLEREGFKIIGEAADGREALRIIGERQPAVAILDIGMPGLNGIDAARAIVHTSPHTRTILLTVHTEETYILEALRAGVNAYVLKSQALADLVHAIREVTRGRLYLSPGVSRTVVEAYQGRSGLNTDPLSPRERQVLQLVAEGRTAKQVAELLDISVKTAECHRSRIMGKLNIHHTAGLVMYAIRRGLIQP